MTDQLARAWRGTRLGVFFTTAGFCLGFCALAVFDLGALSNWVDAGSSLVARGFGLYWQILLPAIFLIALAIALSPAGKIRLGGRDTPEFPYFQWSAMIACTLLGAGGVFWAAAEPLAHFLTPPPNADVSASAQAAVDVALAQSFLHWGFPAWAALGALSAILLMYYEQAKGLPLAPRTLLYPVLGRKLTVGPLGGVADTFALIGVIAGTVGPIGFLGLQVSAGLSNLFGFPEGLPTQIGVIIALASIYITSALTGLSRGIQILSRFNIILTGLLLVFILAAGPTGFIIRHFLSGMAHYLLNFFPIALQRDGAGLFGESGWLNGWTLFFWAWFIGYGPMMAIFIARISRGRSIRSIIMTLSVVAPLATHFWFTILGGSGLAFELAEPGSVSGAFEGFDLPAALLAITQSLPLALPVSILFLILTTVFVATTGDSMTFAISSALSKEGEPSGGMRAFWGLVMAAMAIVLVSAGNGGGAVGKLQQFIVITGAPVSLMLLPSLWDAPRIALKLMRETQS